MWEELARALCLMLILEGALPFLYPGRWRALVASLAMIDNKNIRVMGLAFMAVGVILLVLLS